MGAKEWGYIRRYFRLASVGVWELSEGCEVVESESEGESESDAGKACACWHSRGEMVRCRSSRAP
jgi:hypothetical protein